MARSRNIKPTFFKNDTLAELPFEARLLFIGLWTLADRKGRLEDRPKRIGGELFPYETLNVDDLLNQLASKRDPDGRPAFIVRYAAEGRRYIHVVNFCRHQNPHKQECAYCPEPPGEACGPQAVTEQGPDVYSTSLELAPGKHSVSPAVSPILNPDPPTTSYSATSPERDTEVDS